MICADFSSWREAMKDNRGQSVEIEIGCGNGHFLCSYGVRKAGTLLLGIDIKKKRTLKAREKAAKQGLSNIHIIHGSAEDALAEQARSSVDAFHIYFPDPWPKSKHRKRRFFTMESLAAMHDRLKDGGRICFGTDFFDYYLQAKVLVALHAGFDLSGESVPTEVLSSIFCQRSAKARKAIHLFSAVKRPLPDEGRQREEDERDVDCEVQSDEES